jgi:MFS family permease
LSLQPPWWKTLSRYQWAVLFMAWLGWVFDIMDTSLFNFAKTPMLKELLPGDAKGAAVIDGTFFTILLVGWALGGLLFGALADRWGRVRTMVVTVLVYCLFTGLTAACHTWQEVAVIRFITALGIGGEWAAGASLVAETFPDRARAPGAGLLQTAAAFGPWFASLINLVVPAAHWRVLFLVGILPAAITVFMRMAIREPENWEATVRERGPNPLVQLFGHPVWRRHAIVALLIGVSGIAAAGNISYWLPNLTKAVSQGLSPEQTQARLSYVTLSMHVGTLFGVLLMPKLCELIGRRRALLAFFVLSPVSVALANYGGGSYERLLLLAPLMSFFTIGASAGFVLYFPELFPTAIRATGAGFAYNTGRIVAAAVPLFTGLMISSKSVSYGVTITAFVTLLGVVAILFAPETKGQRLPEHV